jgi:SAM-dependent methyltransferase
MNDTPSFVVSKRSEELQHRSRHREFMDAETADPAELRRSLLFIERVNRRFGYTTATLQHLAELTMDWPSGRPLSILDIATGSADVPRAVCCWADRRGISVRVVGVDRHPETLLVAREQTRDDRITLLQGDALCLPFAAGSFDVVMSSMFLHHLDDADVVKVIRSADALARHGVILADLARSRRALAWISLFTLFSNPMVKHDARVSVKQAFRPAEIEALAREAEIGYLKCHKHFGHRFVLAGKKPSTGG